MNNDERSPGWDKRAVNLIAKEQYGGLRPMFDEHGWTTDGRIISQIAPTKVVETYGSIAAFELAHRFGKGGNAVLDPQAAILRKPPDVWLTSYYGFDPETWGLVTFTDPADRANFVEQSAPGALVVVYGTKSLKTKDAGRILGVQQVSHIVGPSEDFIEPTAWAAKQGRNPKSWNYGVQCTRAWRLPEEFRPLVDDFAPDTYSTNDARTIGRRGKRMTSREARTLLKLPFIEVPVYNGQPVELLPPQLGEIVLTPSKPGPVSQTPRMVREAEGEKHLYILKMRGELQHFIGEKPAGRRIVKVGFSVSPDSRRMAFDAALPGNRISWEVHRSTFKDGMPPFPSSKHALAGEKAMVNYLKENGRSLGGEFFLASDDAIERAWSLGVKTAKGWRA